MKIHILFKIALFVLSLLLLHFLIALGLKNIFDINPKYGNEVVFLSLDISFLIIIFIMIKMWELDIPKLFKKVSVRHIFYLLAIGLLIILLFPVFNIPNLVNSFSTNNTGIMMPSNTFFENENFFVSKPYYVIRTLLLMPILEEILYRGIIQNKLSEKFSAAWAIVISSLLFAVGHLAFEQSITVFFTSLLMGYIYYKSKNLTTAVLIHSSVNVGFLFLKIEYTDTISVAVLSYHFILIALVLFISKKYPKKYSHGN